jgi:hypothetical protein
MPLSFSLISQEIQKINNQEYGGFVGFPVDNTDLSIKWGNAINTFAGLNVLPLSSTTAQAKTAFSQLMATITAPEQADAVLKSAFAAYAATLAGGMAPAFTATPPPAIIDFKPVATAGFAGASAKTCADIMAGIILAWFKTGTATPSAGGSPIPWS